ncbi:MAG: hypothetical protein K9K67_13810 [Bacteriovoracaceae bacterium]|nr:hypothetical protein [Bacteriovoracaceae bacterium]
MSWFPILFLIFTSSCINPVKGPLQFRLKSDGEGFSLPDSEASDYSKFEATYANVKKLIFQDKCIRCHGNERQKLGVNLEEYNKVFDFSDFFQPIVVKGDPEASGAYLEVAKGRMPPKNPLSEAEVLFIERWIKEGAIEGNL